MIEAKDASAVAAELAKNLAGVAKNPASFERLPDSFWGYYARGSAGSAKFGVIVTYSEEGSDVDDLIESYERWLEEHKAVKRG